MVDNGLEFSQKALELLAAIELLLCIGHIPFPLHFDDFLSRVCPFATFYSIKKVVKKNISYGKNVVPNWDLSSAEVSP